LASYTELVPLGEDALALLILSQKFV